jgi:hypothetical protein
MSARPRRPRRPRPPSRMIAGWTWCTRFPTTMGIRIAPGEVNFAKSARRMVAVIGPKHDQRSGVKCTIRAVLSGNVSRVVLGERLETYARPPISFYAYKRISFTPAAVASPQSNQVGGRIS